MFRDDRSRGFAVDAKYFRSVEFAQIAFCRSHLYDTHVAVSRAFLPARSRPGAGSASATHVPCASALTATGTPEVAVSPKGEKP